MTDNVEMQTSNKRSLWPFLLALPPLAAVICGVVMIVLATGTPDALVVSDYSRIEALTSDRFSGDAAAAAAGIAADVRIEPLADGQVVIEISLSADTPASLPDTVRVALQHAMFEQHDVQTIAQRSGAIWSAQLQLASGAYDVTLSAQDQPWRLVGRLHDGARQLRLTPTQSKR